MNYRIQIAAIISTIYRYRYLTAVIIFVIAVSFSLHFSSIAMWDFHVPGDEQQKNINIWGRERNLRADEWENRSIIFLAQTRTQDFYPLINNNFGTGMNMFLAEAPVFDLSLVGRPQHWGFLLLGAERGFSWYWWFRLLLLFFTSFELIRYFTNDRKGYAFAGAILITFSPLVQWWYVETFVDLFIFFQLILVCLISYFKVSECLIKKALYLVGMAIGLCGFAFSFFPAVALPLFSPLLLFIVLILWNNRKAITRQDWLMAGSCVVFVFFVTGYAFLRSWEDIKLALNISQAQRFLLPGQYDIYWQIYEYFSLLLPFRDSTLMSNPDASRFITLMPLTLFLFPVLTARTHRTELTFFQVSVYCLLLILCTWTYVPMPTSLGKLFSSLTLLFSTTRVQIILGLFGVYLLCMVLSLRENIGFALYEKLLLSFITLSSVLYALYYEPVKNYLGSYLTPMLVFFLLVSMLLVWGKPKWCAVLLCVCVFGAGVSVNPLAQGLDPIYNKPVSREIEKIQKENPHARWILMTNLRHTFLPALGVKCFNTVQLTPFLDQWKLFDPEEKYLDMYNRFAFASVRFTDKETFFESNENNQLVLHLNTKELPLANAEYIYADMELGRWNTTDTIFRQRYYDSYNGSRIYQIESLSGKTSVIFNLPLPQSLETIMQNTYDIVSVRILNTGFALNCGEVDPQLYLVLSNTLEKPNGSPFVQIAYTNTEAGYLQIYYDYGSGLSEENSAMFHIASTVGETTIQLPVVGWHEKEQQLIAIRIDPPSSTEFTMMGISFLSLE